MSVTSKPSCALSRAERTRTSRRQNWNRAQLRIQFLGATGTVTGSKYLISAGNQRILIDCGLFEGLKQLRLRNWDAAAGRAGRGRCRRAHARASRPQRLSAAVRQTRLQRSGLLHARDRGLLPDSLARQRLPAGRGGRVREPARLLQALARRCRCTRCAMPSAACRRSHPSTSTAVDRAAGRTELPIAAAPVISLARRWCCSNTAATTVLFSGDLGRPADPVIGAPEAVAHADYLILESTYGDRPPRSGRSQGKARARSSTARSPAAAA